VMTPPSTGAYVRPVQINAEEARTVLAMNRLRKAYLTMAPGLEPYFSTGHHDEQRSSLAAIRSTRERFPTRRARGRPRKRRLAEREGPERSHPAGARVPGRWPAWPAGTAPPGRGR
jgi:hypothetical protein